MPLRSRFAPLVTLLASLAACTVLAPITRAQDTWLPRNSGVTTTLAGVTYAAGQWITVGDQGVILTSADGTAWTPRASGTSASLTAVAHGNGLFAAVGDSSTILTSPDGFAWTSRNRTGPRLNALTYGNGMFLAAGESGTRWISLDGITWSQAGISAPNSIHGLVYAAPAFVLSAERALFTTINTESFTRPFDALDVIFEGVAYSRDRFVALGTAGFVATSRDGTTWTSQNPSPVASPRALAFFNNQFVGVGADGAVATSFDGTSWASRSSGTTQSLLAIAPGPGSAIAVGFGGTVLQSSISLAAPGIVTPPASLTEAVGGHIAFTVTVRGSTPLSYQWRKDNLLLTGATSETLFVPNLASAHAGNYACTVTNSAGSVTSSPAALTVLAAFAAPDSVDPSFLVTPPLTSAPRAVTVQPDGKILLVRDSPALNGTAPSSTLTRLLPNGTLDASFTPSSLDSAGDISSLAVQPDGRILLGGTFTSVGGVARKNFARLNPDGSLDPTFAPPGNFLETAQQLLLTPDGKILAVTSGSSLARFNPDGSLDASVARTAFAIGTMLVDNIRPTLPPVVRTVFGLPRLAALQPDGKTLVIVGSPTDAHTFLLFRLNSDGALDSAFASRRVSNGYTTAIKALRVLADGTIMVAGINENLFSDATPVIQRFTSAGVPDATFKPTLPSPDTLTTTIAFDATGRTWLSGSWSLIDGSRRHQLARLTPDGSLDFSYQLGSGLATRDGTPTGASTILPLADGRVLLAGDFATVDGLPRPYLATLNVRTNLGATRPRILSVAPTFISVRAGESFSLNVTATGTGALTYEGKFPNGNQTTGSSALLVSGNSQISGPARITVSNAAGVSESALVYVRVIPSAPVITRQPASLQTNTGRIASLDLGVIGSEPLAFEWSRDGVPLPGSNSAVLPLGVVTRASAGLYTVVVRNTLGTATSETVRVGVDEASRLVNLATRARVSLADGPLIAGFSIQGPGTKRLLLRGLGPALATAPFNLPGTLADPVLRVFDSTGTEIYANNDWAQSSAATLIATAPARLGTFPLASTSLDAAGHLELAPGNYTATLTGAAGPASPPATGIALLEIYEDDIASSRLVNLSSRAFVGPGDNLAIPGFVVTGLAPKQFLIRGLGPALAAFGVSGSLADPQLTLADAQGFTIAANDDWETNPNLPDLRRATTSVAFPLAAGSRDAALLITLPPGAYTARVTGANATTGTALVEVYEVP